MAGPTQTVLGRCRNVPATFTRPANATQYAAGEVMGDASVMTFNRVASENLASSVIQHAICIDSASETVKPDLELWLFDTTVTADADNAAFTPTDAEMLTLIDVIEFPSSAWKVGTAGGNSVNVQRNLGIPVKPNGTEIYGVMVVRNTYTPVSGEQIKVILRVVD